MRLARTVAAALLAAILLGLAGCPRARQNPTTGKRPASHPNVILIVIDTLRADHVGCYGRSPSPTPNLDALAQRGIRFAQLYSNSPWTIPSMGSLFTSLYPSECALGRVAGDSLEDVWSRYVLGIAPGLPTLAETFSAAGYATVGLTANMYLGPGYEVDLRRGFQRFWGATTPAEETGDILTRRATRFLETPAPEPFLLWLQYMDPHSPYSPPQLPPAAPGSEEERLRQLPMTAYRNQPFSASENKRLVELYDLEVQYADQQVGRLLQLLDQRGLRRRTVVFVTSDHGEEFWEHAGIGHGHSLFDEQLHVPGILLLPSKRDAGIVVERQVSLLDVAPTLAALAAIPIPPGWHGKPLVPLTERPSLNNETLYAESLRYGPEQRAARSPDYKCIQPAGAHAVGLYDLRRDAAENHNLGAAPPSESRALLSDFSRWATEMKRRAAELRPKMTPRRHPLTQEQQERLRRLGYLGK